MAEEIQINVKGPGEIKLQITIATDKTVLELKQAVAEKSDVEAERQRLIYSGRVLKDEDALSTYKISSGHTIHMVKGVARGNTSSSAAAPQPLPTMQTGQNPHDPLTLLNSHLGYGAMAGINPFADMGLNQNDPNMLQTMMNSPEFLQQMAGMMSNPAVLDQIIASNPQLQAMAPQAREMFQSEGFRQMISDPQRLQQMMQMASMLQGGGAGGLGGMGGFGMGGGGSSFPAPGVPGGGTPTTGAAAATSPRTGAAAAGTGTTPLPTNLFNPYGGIPPAPTQNARPPFALDPALARQLLLGGGLPGGLAGGPGGFGAAPTAPTDTRSPEERFQVQLQQLQDMGFTNASQNVRALLATGGNVHSAIEYILGGGGV
ncbi:uncharacterized protein EV420DRAFT_1520653 [Desarmillaria tabescens]|uniref:Ubiquitin-domain-containing protein n=1 Tax=Armillaria tabescens TaxID=1929756 RepID=A0AA39NDZ9_ARMTA|nr:uncharacterized protein EV420DRAFT_1520653 [Desarmillaria tabescens]KAK0463906.1 hypothetical protein EV420DRAFT_1520653 [Desarmillaria tabescens]